MIDFQHLWLDILAFHWLWKFLLGMYIAYYIMSPKLRRITNRFFVWVFHTGSPFIKPKRQPIRYIPRQPIVEKPTILSKAQPIDRYASNNHIQVDESELEEWFNNNPSLKKANEV